MSGELYYDSVEDFPLYNWRKCQEKEDYTFCRIDRKKGSEIDDLKAWEQIYNSYITEFGLGKDYTRILELQKEIALIQLDFAIENDRYKLNKIRELQRELKELIEREHGGDTDTILNYLRKWMGHWIDPKKITVFEFYKLIRDYQKEMNQIKKSA